MDEYYNKMVSISPLRESTLTGESESESDLYCSYGAREGAAAQSPTENNLGGSQLFQSLQGFSLDAKDYFGNVMVMSQFRKSNVLLSTEEQYTDGEGYV